MVPTKRHSSAKANSSILSGNDKVSTVQEYAQGLVDSRIRVWWPLDRKFYEGVVESYSSSRSKHRVLYDDGDVEILDMRKQQWELIEEDEETVAEEISVEEAATDESSADGTPQPKKTRAGKGKVVATMPIKKQKIDSSTKSKLGNVGGKVLAAASRMSVRSQRKDNGQPKALSSRKNTAASGNPKWKRVSSSSEAASEKLKKRRASSRKMKSNNPDDENTCDDDDSKPLVSFLNKLKGRRVKEVGERSSKNGVEEESSGSEAGDDTSDNESGESSSGNEEGKGRGGREGEEGDGSEGSEGSEEWEEEGESTGNETDES